MIYCTLVRAIFLLARNFASVPGKIGVSPIPSFLFVYPRFLASAVRSATSRARPESPTPPPWLLRRLCDQPPQNMSPLLLGSVQGGCGSSARGAVHFGSMPRLPQAAALHPPQPLSAGLVPGRRRHRCRRTISWTRWRRVRESRGAAAVPSAA